ncbi:FAD-binding oxidoreductase [Bradyrhizobium diazoefficiens]|uniref:FAD-binding oxidoreductase n=1 Tax=Bradyrhizobium diazoefficiens TaxID=1355477 RepID=UPI001B4D232A|nr:FAD/FMN-containing dehydrogenase [Bradyrhizobium japonicum]
MAVDIRLRAGELVRRLASLPPLPKLSRQDATLLKPDDPEFWKFQPSFNARTTLVPKLRALCKTPKSVGVMIDWCRSNRIPFALRSGGHCYEGLSQSCDVVVDTRCMDMIKVDRKTNTATVGAGASLGALYKAIAPAGLSFPAGSCPTVGIAGHVLGGGYGYLGRALGLACDSALGIDLVDCDGADVVAHAHQNSDLFWACRGGGGGSFGAATSFRLQLHPLRSVYVFRATWNVSVREAVRIFKDWQSWAPDAPHSINAIMIIFSHPAGIALRCIGQSIGSLAELQKELSNVSSSPEIQKMDYFSAINRFAGKDGWKYISAPMKGKSDYVTSALTDAGVETLLDEVRQRKNVTVICDPYGGAISGVGSGETAFAHRAGTRFCMQYVTDWWCPDEERPHLRDMDSVYLKMRAHVSGAAYVNYCDLDLANYASSYWGSNLERLKQVKAGFDPDDVFHHAQSVPRA